MAAMLSVWEKSIHGCHVVCMGEVTPWLVCCLYGLKSIHGWYVVCMREVIPWLVCCLYVGSQCMAGILSVYEKSGKLSVCEPDALAGLNIVCPVTSVLADC